MCHTLSCDAVDDAVTAAVVVDNDDDYDSYDDYTDATLLAHLRDLVSRHVNI